MAEKNSPFRKPLCTFGGLRQQNMTVLVIERGEQIVRNPGLGETVQVSDELLCFGELDQKGIRLVLIDVHLPFRSAFELAGMLDRLTASCEQISKGYLLDSVQIFEDLSFRQFTRRFPRIGMTVLSRLSERLANEIDSRTEESWRLADSGMGFLNM